ncbi:MAG: hypothetical protein NWE94_01830 [Candidatus Bathyarchaeota archaeon]|nr:hypothetical protein [Candidatus Bathyarchaeota archaeon]
MAPALSHRNLADSSPKPSSNLGESPEGSSRGLEATGAVEHALPSSKQEANPKCPKCTHKSPLFCTETCPCDFGCGDCVFYRYCSKHFDWEVSLCKV